VRNAKLRRSAQRRKRRRETINDWGLVRWPRSAITKIFLTSAHYNLVRTTIVRNRFYITKKPSCR